MIEASDIAPHDLKILILSNCEANPDTGSGFAVKLVLDALRETGSKVEFNFLRAVGLFGSGFGARYLAPILWAFKGFVRSLGGKHDVIICFGGEWGVFTYLHSCWRRTTAPRCIQYSNGVESHASFWMHRAEQSRTFPRPRWYQRGNLSWLHDLAFTHADQVAVLSEFDARYLTDKLGLASNRVTVLHDPLPDYFLSIPLRLDRPKNIGYCGTWLPRKNISLMLADIQLFLSRHQEWRFEAVGPGTEILNQRGYVSAELASRIKGLGVVPKRQLPVWYQGCSVFVLPSAYESFGLVAAEAMACGCAVVASKSAAFPASLQSRREVYLLHDTVPPYLAAALEEISEDDNLRQQLAIGGYGRVQSLSGAQWRKEFYDFLNRLCIRERA